MPELRPKYHRECLDDAQLAPVMTPGLWNSYAQLSNRYPVIMGVLAYILDMGKEDMMEMGTTLIETEAGKLKMARLQGQMMSKQAIVGRICDLMGDLALAGEDGDEVEVSGGDDTPSWALPDDHEEEERKASRYRKQERPQPRTKLPIPKRNPPARKKPAAKRRK